MVREGEERWAKMNEVIRRWIKRDAKSLRWKKLKENEGNHEGKRGEKEESEIRLLNIFVSNLIRRMCRDSHHFRVGKSQGNVILTWIPRLFLRHSLSTIRFSDLRGADTIAQSLPRYQHVIKMHVRWLLIARFPDFVARPGDEEYRPPSLYETRKPPPLPNERDSSV